MNILNHQMQLLNALDKALELSYWMKETTIIGHNIYFYLTEYGNFKNG